MPLSAAEVLNRRTMNAIDEIFERYDTDGDSWMSYDDAARWMKFVEDSFVDRELHREWKTFMGYQMQRIQAAHGVSLGDFRGLHQDLLRYTKKVGGNLHDAIERHLFTQHGYEWIEEGVNKGPDPASLAELSIDVGGDEGGVCPSVTHFVGERISSCKMTRNRGPHGMGELAIAVGTSGEARNHIHLGWLVSSERGGLPRVLPGAAYRCAPTAEAHGSRRTPAVSRRRNCHLRSQHSGSRLRLA